MAWHGMAWHGRPALESAASSCMVSTNTSSPSTPANSAGLPVSVGTFCNAFPLHRPPSSASPPTPRVCAFPLSSCECVRQCPSARAPFAASPPHGAPSPKKNIHHLTVQRKRLLRLQRFAPKELRHLADRQIHLSDKRMMPRQIIFKLRRHDLVHRKSQLHHLHYRLRHWRPDWR